MEMRVSGRFLLRGILAAALFTIGTSTGSAADDAESCFELGNLTLDAAYVTSANVVDAAGFVVSWGEPTRAKGLSMPWAQA
jgi:hypothetical protein